MSCPDGAATCRPTGGHRKRTETLRAEKAISGVSAKNDNSLVFSATEVQVGVHTLRIKPRYNHAIVCLKAQDPIVAGKSRRHGMAPAHAMVLLSQKPSAKKQDNAV